MTDRPSNAALALDLAAHADAGTAAIVHALLAIADAITEASPKHLTGGPERGLEQPRTPNPASVDPQPTDEPRRTP